jgi:Diaminopimelate decarboxylase
MDIKTLKEAALKFGTPIYLYDLKIIKNQFDKLNKALSVLENYKIHFAAKSLSNISVLKYINKMGAGLDAVSIEEVMMD